MNQIQQFAQLLSEGVSARDAAARLGIEPAHGRILLYRIRKQLGPQAK